MTKFMNVIIPVVFAVVLSIPILLSIPFLLKVLFLKNYPPSNFWLFESPFKSTRLSLVLKKTFTVLGLFCAILLLYVLTAGLIMDKAPLPFPLNWISLILFIFYYGCFGALYGLQSVTEAGGSGSSILSGLLKMVRGDKLNEERRSKDH